MKAYLLSLGAGLLVGLVYSLLHVRSPAPPLVALVGLLGILLGEQALPLASRMLTGSSFHMAWRSCGADQHLFGRLPGRSVASSPTAATTPSPASSKDVPS